MTTSDTLRAPFPYFGGKRAIADLVWAALGGARVYLEPFFGSGAVLLARPDWDPTKHIETVNDADGFIANLWRALQHDPDEVAKWCDWPVNHACLSARKRRLIANEARLLEDLTLDDEWYDAKLAGYWIWAASCWIGSGLTRLGKIPRLSDGGKGVHAIGKIPHVSNGGKGVHAIGQIPHVGHGGKGVHAIGQIPHVSHGGVGVHAIGQIPHVSHGGVGVQEPYNTNIYDWFRRLSERLRYVRVVCGDWTRVCGGDWQDTTGDVGIFFDPPYGVEDRDSGIYHKESLTVAQDVAKWCLERGSRSSYRIVLAGYYSEHEWLLAHGWTAKRWTASRGYAKEGTQGQLNRHRECLFLSPYCAKEEIAQPKLFD